ncbi:hypothetical protein ACG1BZ_15420 [Microbulbifer sp. CNSA002]|uniref:hypothetical protein n=1 Tax=unclassified Microbulbifer TaxID=2619833 RepID=UPI0039B5E19E
MKLISVFIFLLMPAFSLADNMESLIDFPKFSVSGEYASSLFKCFKKIDISSYKYPSVEVFEKGEILLIQVIDLGVTDKYTGCRFRGGKIIDVKSSLRGVEPDF